MLFAYLDEFGHCGPFVHRNDAAYKDSPVFGLAGLVLPESAIRPFATCFLQLKEATLADDIARSGMAAHQWEKKGSSIFRPRALDNYPAVRSIGFRLLSLVKRFNGKVFYYGREKIIGSTDVNANGLYTTIFSKSIRRLESYASSLNSNFLIVVDQHSARKELLECAAKTMFGQRPTRHLISPPFEVESYVNQNIQAADWLSAIIGRIHAYKCLPDQFHDYDCVDKYFSARIAQLATHSTVEKRPAKAQVKTIAVADVTISKTIRYSILDQAAIPLPHAANSPSKSGKRGGRG